jgi:hypothetical protein
MPLRSRFSASAGADARPPLKVEAYPPPARRRAGTGTTLCTLRPHGSKTSRHGATIALTELVLGGARCPCGLTTLQKQSAPPRIVRRL